MVWMELQNMRIEANLKKARLAELQSWKEKA